MSAIRQFREVFHCILDHCLKVDPLDFYTEAVRWHSLELTLFQEVVICLLAAGRPLGVAVIGLDFAGAVIPVKAAKVQRAVFLFEKGYLFIVVSHANIFLSFFPRIRVDSSDVWTDEDVSLSMYSPNFEWHHSKAVYSEQNRGDGGP